MRCHGMMQCAVCCFIAPARLKVLQCGLQRLLLRLHLLQLHLRRRKGPPGWSTAVPKRAGERLCAAAAALHMGRSVVGHFANASVQASCAPSPKAKRRDAVGAEGAKGGAFSCIVARSSDVGAAGDTGDSAEGAHCSPSLPSSLRPSSSPSSSPCEASKCALAPCCGANGKGIRRTSRSIRSFK